MASSLQSDFSATATVSGRVLGGFQTFEGGAVTASAEKDRPPTGNDIDQPIPGPRSIDNVTISRTYDDTRDGPLLAFLEGQVGRGDATVARHPLDADGNPRGTDRTYTCLLIRVTGPAGDRNAATTKATLELEFACGAVG